MKDVYDLTKYLVVLQTARLLLQPIGSVLFYFYSKVTFNKMGYRHH